MHVPCVFVFVAVLTTALSDYEHALVLDPTEVYLMKGNALSVLDQHQDALMTYKKALALKPSEIGLCHTTNILYYIVVHTYLCTVYSYVPFCIANTRFCYNVCITESQLRIMQTSHM
jgi:tetratricopeptide (TPR) repeat protein